MDSERPTGSFSNSRREFIKLAASEVAAATSLSAVSVSAAQDTAPKLLDNEPGPYIVFELYCHSYELTNCRVSVASRSD